MLSLTAPYPPLVSGFEGLRRLGDLGREIERRRGPDPYPRPAGPPPPLEELRRRRDETMPVAGSYGASAVSVFGSVARGDARPDSDLDLLIEVGEANSLFKRAALQGELEDLLGCPVRVVTTGGLKYARSDARRRIEREAVSL